MRGVLAAVMVVFLVRAELVMGAVSTSARLFVTAVMPGLFPYMVLSGMLVSRFRRIPGWLLMLLGWGGGSPTGARLLGMAEGLSRRRRVRLAVSTATMSPMFLVGTCGGWLGSATAGIVLMASVLAGGWLAGAAAGALGRYSDEGAAEAAGQGGVMTFGAAVEQAARTMLLVCGTMAMLRAFAELAVELAPALALPVKAVLEVTAGVQAAAGLSLPLALRTALIAGITGFGGMAGVMQNRTLYPPGLMRLPEQLLWQMVHGALSFLLALGMMLLIG